MPDSITSFEVYRTTIEGQFPDTPLVTLPGTARSYEDTTPPSPRFWYKLIGRTAEGLEIPYNIVQIGPNTWAKGFGGTSYNYGQAVAVGPDGNVVFGGVMNGSADFGSGTLNSAGVLDLVLAKYSPATGDCLWSRRFGNTGDEYVKSVGVDSSGNIFVGGSGTAVDPSGNHVRRFDFGDGPRDTQGSSDAVIAKYNSNGDCLWVKQFGLGPSTGQCSVDCLVVASNGDVIIAGYFNRGINFGGSTFGSAFNGNNIFVARLSGADGSHVWSKGWTTYGNSSQATGIVMDSSGNLFISGFQIGGYTDFEAPVGRLSCPNVTPCAMLLKLNGVTGSPLAGRLFGGTASQGGERAFGVVLQNDKPVLGGNFLTTGGVNFGNGHVLTKSHNKPEVFLVGFSNDISTCLWSTNTVNVRGADNHSFASLSVDSNNRVMVSGWYQFTIEIGGTQLTGSTGAGHHYMFVAYYNSSGGFISANKVGGEPSSNYVAPTNVTAAGTNFYITGYFLGTINFYGTSLSQHSSYDAFLVKV